MDETSGKQNYYPSPMATSTGPNPSPDGFPTQPGGPNPPQAGFQGPYAFSPEEIRVLRECNRESLLFRCIPLATITSALTYFGISRGYIKPSASFGVFPKVTLAAICGYVLGKLSYQRQCADMIAKLPNSKLADAIRKSRGLSVQLDGSDSEFGPGGGTHEVFTSIPSQPIFDDHKPDERDRNEALDDYNRITESLSEYTEPSLSSTQTPVSTYDERRRLNREEYVAKVMQRNRGSVSELRQELPRPPISSGSTSVSSGSTPVARRNQYGDLVYDE